MLLHVAHCALQGLRKVVNRSVETYVVVLAIGHFLAHRLDELWFSFCVGTHFRQIAIHAIVNMSMKKHRCSSMLSVGATWCLASSAAGTSQHG